MMNKNKHKNSDRATKQRRMVVVLLVAMTEIMGARGWGVNLFSNNVAQNDPTPDKKQHS